jgi:hypothetical protein
VRLKLHVVRAERLAERSSSRDSLRPATFLLHSGIRFTADQPRSTRTGTAGHLMLATRLGDGRWVLGSLGTYGSTFSTTSVHQRYNQDRF